MPLRVFEYSNCSTCKKALKYLDANDVKYERIAIVDHPPSVAELKRMLTHLKAGGRDLKSLFNTSGVLYRELKVADRLKSGMNEADALKLLSENGKLIKRPFILGSKAGAVGFKEAEWLVFKRESGI